jgi:hypothetical protein
MRLHLPLSRGASGVAPTDWTHRIVFERQNKDLDVFLAMEITRAFNRNVPSTAVRFRSRREAG